MLSGAWALLLAGLTNRQDVVFGATVSGRPAELPGIDGTIGMFLNTVPVRATLNGGEGVAAFLARHQAEQAELLPHHQTGLGAIQRGTGFGRLFDTLQVLRNTPPTPPPGPNCANASACARSRTSTPRTSR